MHRASRLARNEALFREVNERIAELAHPQIDSLQIVCECASIGCQTQLAVPIDEYRETREHPHRFIVAPGHIVLDAEHLVASNDGYQIVDKHPDLAVDLEPELRSV
jgi:hypothetical protein